MTDTGTTDTAKPRSRRPPRAPRWVIVFGIVSVILVVAFFVLHFMGMAPTQHGM